ncbi:hypothetical protein IFM89_037030 [Coptis chinensis]|uniref:F-box associated beta-propeller type 3 domain-containing protein n=1 Tax=Coptis chinensis TaxID=261450 RepID=A0A835LU90_9MAGN|nr:hypothetical protein IFM89_037030 [Coptis chinensis]
MATRLRCSLHLGRWREVSINVPCLTKVVQSNVLVNGRYHWAAYTVVNCVIVSFDVATEEFNTIQLPTNFNKRNNLNIIDGLMVLGDCLSMIVDRARGYGF